AGLTAHEFLVLNAIAWCVMVIGVALVALSPSCRFLLVAFGGVILLNAFLHLTFSILTRSYSPGVVSGLLCWAPLGLYTLSHEQEHLSRSKLALGIALSFVLHAVVSFSALVR